MRRRGPDRGGGDDDAEQQAVHIHGEVPLDAVGFLAAIPAAAESGHGVGGGYRLRVDDRRARAPVQSVAEVRARWLSALRRPAPVRRMEFRFATARP